MRIILASGSPRRRELMGLFTGFETVVCPAHGEERQHPELTPEGLVCELSRLLRRNRTRPSSVSIWFMRLLTHDCDMKSFSPAFVKLPYFATLRNSSRSDI